MQTHNFTGGMYKLHVFLTSKYFYVQYVCKITGYYIYSYMIVYCVPSKRSSLYLKLVDNFSSKIWIYYSKDSNSDYNATLRMNTSRPSFKTFKKNIKSAILGISHSMTLKVAIIASFSNKKVQLQHCVLVVLESIFT